MEQYPEGLLRTIAANLLKKKNGQRETEAILKEAAEQLPLSPQARREEFLKQYKMTPDQFQGDSEAERFVKEKRQAAEGQVKDFYRQQRKNGVESPDLDQAEQEILQKINKQSEGVAERISIDRTRKIAEKNPEQFNNFRSLSSQSENALAQSHGKETGSMLGGFAGGAAGLLAGRRLPKNTKGILQQTGSAAIGSVLGGAAGGAIGSNRDEKRTGFNHEDVMKPFEIAGRIQNQQDFR